MSGFGKFTRSVTLAPDEHGERNRTVSRGPMDEGSGELCVTKATEGRAGKRSVHHGRLRQGWRHDSA